jgi:hypothetical protein
MAARDLFRRHDYVALTTADRADELPAEPGDFYFRIIAFTIIGVVVGSIVAAIVGSMGGGSTAVGITVGVVVLLSVVQVFLIRLPLPSRAHRKPR